MAVAVGRAYRRVSGSRPALGRIVRAVRQELLAAGGTEADAVDRVERSIRNNAVRWEHDDRNFVTGERSSDVLVEFARQCLGEPEEASLPPRPRRR
jgi:hypothetical protein